MKVDGENPTLIEQVSSKVKSDSFMINSKIIISFAWKD